MAEALNCSTIVNRQAAGIVVSATISISLGLCDSISANELQAIRFGDSPSYTRIVFDLQSEADYKYNVLTNPPRLYVDLRDTRAVASFEVPKFENELIRSVRHARRGGSYRIVLDLHSDPDPNIRKFDPYGPYGHRLVIDLHRESTATQECRQEVSEPSNGNVVVVLDAGHGGEDPGAIAVNGVYEKNITLSIVKLMKSKLDATDGYEAHLTRSGDYEVPLKARRSFAESMRAHLFVSIHADAFKTPRVRGASVWMLSTRKAEDELSRWLLENENRSDWVGGVADWVNTGCFENQEVKREVAKLLGDKARDATMIWSHQVARSILGSLASEVRVHQSRRVRDAAFVVLKSTTMPSILVETGFLSNPQEAKQLTTKAHQDKVATLLVNGIKAHFCREKPPNTKLRSGEVGCNPTLDHLVKRGDTLGEIALSYQVSVVALRIANDLKGDLIRPGEVLTIPSGSGI